MSLDREHSQSERRDAARAAAASRKAELRRWERMRTQGRTYFIWRHGVVGWGIPAAILTMVYKLFEARGLAWSLTVPLSGDLRHAFVLIAVAFPALGYVLGGWLWNQGEERYWRLQQDRDC